VINQQSNPKSSVSGSVDGIFKVLVVLFHFSLVALTWMILLMGSERGLDFTDEGFALMSYRHPGDVDALVSAYHLVLRPIYTLGAENLAFIRIFGMIVVVASAGLASFVTWRFLSMHKCFHNHSNNFAGSRFYHLNLFAMALGGAALFYMDWRLTPTYDWIAFVGPLVFWVGLLLWFLVEQAARSALGATLIGFSGIFTFWGKPTSAAFLLLFLIIALWFNRHRLGDLLKMQTIYAGIAGFMVGLILPFLQSETPDSLMTKLQLGLDYQNQLKPEQLSGLPGFLAVELAKLLAVFYALFIGLMLSAPIWIGFLLSGLATVWLGGRLSLRSNLRLYLMEWLYVIGWIGTLAWLYENQYVELGWTGLLSLSLVVVATVYLFVSYVIYQRIIVQHTQTEFLRRLRTDIRWMIPFLGLWIAFNFGTNSFYLIHGNRGSLLLLLAVYVPIIAYSAPLNRLFRSAITLSILVITLSIVWQGSQNGYRQGTPIWSMDYRVEIPERDQTLMLSRAYSMYVESLQTLAYTNGFEPDTPVIDLTGRSPGIAYVLNGRAPVFPFLLGGYGESSNKANTFLLSQWDAEELRRAWVITETDLMNGKMSPDILIANALPFPDEYVPIGDAMLSGRGVTLWRPNWTAGE